MFMDDLTPVVPSYDGRNNEPVTLPCKLPLLLMLGAEGIAVGLSTNVLPHNFIELLQAQINIIQKKPFTIYPDFLTAGLMDVSQYEKGQGKITLRARLSYKKSEKSIIRVSEIPYSTTTDSLIKSIEDAAKKGKIKVKSINDFTSEKIEIEIKLGQGEDPDKAIQALFAFTQCEVSLSSRLISIENNRPVELTVDEVLKRNTRQLIDLLKAELELREQKLEQELHSKTLVQLFVENRIYKGIEQCKTSEAVKKAVLDGFEPFREKLKRWLNDQDVEMLLGIRIRRISLFDINKHRQDMERILEELADIRKNLKQLNKYAVAYLKKLIKQYSADYPRLTEIEAFEEIDVQEIAAEHMELKYDAERGYIGYDVPGETCVKCTNFDKVVVVMSDGKYKVGPPPERLFVDKNMIYADVIDKEKVMTVVYTVDQVTYMKRFTFGGFIMNKEYTCTADGAEVLLFTDANPEKLFVKYKPAKGQRIHQQEFSLHDIPVKSVKARGNQVTVKKIAKISTTQPRGWDENAGPPGVTL
jgi:topoisomerase-4 subunit A